MKKLLFSCATILALSGTAMAADPFEPATPYDWSGPYLGVHGGYLWGDVEVDYEELVNIGGDIDGFIGGGLAGFNLQSGNLVFGVEGDFGLTGADGTGVANPDDVLDIYAYSYDLDWNAHLRGRVGLAMDRTLLFIAGGLAIAEHELGVNYPRGGDGSGSETHYGFTIGGGAEYAVSDNLLLRLEYLYDDYGKERYNFGEDPGDHYDVDFTTHTIRAAVSFKF